MSDCMTSDEFEYDEIMQLTAHANHLNSIDTPQPNVLAKYEIMSGALVWSDETNGATPCHVVWALRRLFAYRTRLILDVAELDGHFWNRCVEMFPNWIGFLPSRRTATLDLLNEYRHGDLEVSKCIKELEYEADENDL